MGYLMQSETPTCTHIKTDGIRCGSPAMRGRPFCYFHRRYYDGTAIRPDRFVPARDFPLLRNSRDVRTSITTVVRYMHEGRITPEQARPMVHCLNIAASLCPDKKKRKKKRRR